MNAFARRASVLASLLLLSSTVTFAAGPLDGGWVGEISSDGGNSQIMMSLTANDTVLTGSIIGNGIETSIQDGTFEGNTITFKTVQRDGEHSLTISCTGSLVEDSIAFKCSADGQDDREFTVKRNPTTQP